MVCDTQLSPEQTKAQRDREIRESLKRLENALLTGEAQMNIGPQGGVNFSGKWDRDRVTDACAYRRLSTSNSFALRKAQATAEAISGRKVDARTVAAGVHSHDGGKTWGKH